MSTPFPPVGSGSKRVYRRRRFVVLLVALAIVGVVILMVARPWSTRGDVTIAPTSTASASPSSTPSPTTATVSGCDSSVVTVTAVTDAPTYAAGQNPKLSLALTNSGGAPCTINAGTAAQVFTITGGGGQAYWRSTDCQTKATNAEITLQPGTTESSSSPIVWDRTTSDPATCNAPRLPVPAAGATYDLEVSVDGIASKPTAFVLAG